MFDHLRTSQADADDGGNRRMEVRQRLLPRSL
jgi:hypothetical protein